MIGVIADDLTGAAEIGAVALRNGLRAEIVLGGNPGAQADVICLDTDSRSCDPTEAARRAARAARFLQDWGAQWIYKKTDSVLRGHVTPEIEAIIAELGLDGALLIPANPKLGRTIEGGQYLVRGQLIHQTDFANDPEYPRRTSQVLDLLAKPSNLKLSLGRPGEPLPDRGLVVGEVTGPPNLHLWATCRRENWLAAGGAEFFAALLGPAAPGPREIPIEAGELFVCGSLSEATQQFIAQQAKLGVPVFALPEHLARSDVFPPAGAVVVGEQASCALAGNRRVILHVGLPRTTDPTRARSLAGHLAAVAKTVLRRTAVGHVLAEGGATAAELVRAMGWERLQVEAELAPGVVTLATFGVGPGAFTIKPGSYLWPESLQVSPRANNPNQ